MFRYLVLGLLRAGVAQHGYALMKEYRARSGVAITTGNFYRELHRLVAAGLVRTVMNPEGADARRAPYEITEAGVRAFDGWLSSPRSKSLGQFEDQLSARALFVGEADPAVTRQLLDHWRNDLWLRGKMLERDRETSQRTHVDGKFDALSLLLSRRLKHIAADLEFLEEFRVAYEQWVARRSGEGKAGVRTAPVGSAKRSPSRTRKAVSKRRK
jgi:DNA-binding PadR family transcriptional regulator